MTLGPFDGFIITNGIPADPAAVTVSQYGSVVHVVGYLYPGMRIDWFVDWANELAGAAKISANAIVIAIINFVFFIIYRLLFVDDYYNKIIIIIK